MSELLDSAWEQWYRDRHTYKFSTLSGESFEDYVSTALRLFYPDYLDPDPMGSHGDGGCDGLANSGKTLFACYGQRAKSNQDNKTRDKIEHDYGRALQCWPEITEWVFVTNASVGTESTKLIVNLQKAHAQNPSIRPAVRLITCVQMWNEIVSQLPQHDLDTLLPGAPHAQNVIFDDLPDLIDHLDSAALDAGDIKPPEPVSEQKMDYNHLPKSTKAELNEGRIQAPKLDTWFNHQRDPELRDKKAKAFHQIYQKAAATSSNPAAIMEAIYIAVGGSDCRLSPERINAVYALTSYFFDTCDIFEAVPSGKAVAQ